MTDLGATIAPKSDRPPKRNGPLPVPIRDRIERNIMIVEGCWIWLGAMTKGGYGLMTIRTNKRPAVRCAHRVSYEAYIGSIPDGLTIDHLCRRTWCVNPEHMEPVTIKENILRGEGPSARQARQTCCPKCGGDYTLRTGMRRGRMASFRICQRCVRENNRRWFAKRRAQMQGGIR